MPEKTPITHGKPNGHRDGAHGQFKHVAAPVKREVLLAAHGHDAESFRKLKDYVDHHLGLKTRAGAHGT